MLLFMMTNTTYAILPICLPFKHHAELFHPLKGYKKHIINDVEIGKTDLIFGGESTFSGKRLTPYKIGINRPAFPRKNGKKFGISCRKM